METFLQTRNCGTKDSNYILAILDSRMKFVAHERFQYVLLKKFGEFPIRIHKHWNIHWPSINPSLIWRASFVREWKRFWPLKPTTSYIKTHFCQINILLEHQQQKLFRHFVKPATTFEQIFILIRYKVIFIKTAKIKQTKGRQVEMIFQPIKVLQWQWQCDNIFILFYFHIFLNCLN